MRQPAPQPSAAGPEELRQLLAARLHQFTERQGWGVPLLLYSALLSKGVAAARADMDEGSAAASAGLVAEHGYCGQELVSLLLGGAACGNLFNGSHDLGGGLVLRGVPRRGRVGLLALSEWYRWVVGVGWGGRACALMGAQATPSWVHLADLARRR